jgi:hypothetical protein
VLSSEVSTSWGVLEFLELAEAIGFDPIAALRRIAKVRD